MGYDFFKLQGVDGKLEDKVRIHANITYSYAIIEQAAIDMQQNSKWVDDESVKKLKFSSVWIRGVLDRADMARRKVTTEEKIRPSEATVRHAMSVGRIKYNELELEARFVWNMDETALTWCIGPTHIFIPKQQSRARQIGVVNIKFRITAAIAFNGVGDSAFIFVIINHSVKATSKINPDQSRIRVIRNLHKANLGFGEVEGWELHEWVSALTIDGVTATHRCWYIKH